jgi:hypothetical protein
MMSSHDIQLYDSIFVHQKSQCILHAEASAKLSCAASSPQIADSDESFMSLPLWIPKAQRFTLSLHLDFHDEICYVCNRGKPAAEAIANYVGRAEVS